MEKPNVLKTSGGGRFHVRKGAVDTRSASRRWAHNAKVLAFVMALLLASSVAFAQPAAAGPLEDFGAAVMSFFGLDGGDPSAQDAGEQRVVVDGDTFDSWESYLKDDKGNYSTENIGRIWTDKSVFDSSKTLQGALAGETIEKPDDSDFLVALSALSSTSNQTTATTKPLDIVLVLDMSGSMRFPLEPVAVYDDGSLDTSQTYWVNANQTWYQVRWGTTNADPTSRWRSVSNSNSWYTPLTSPDDRVDNYDANSKPAQFYTASESRLDALQSAAGTFLDEIAEQNEGISDTSAQHQVSIVKFANVAIGSIGDDKISSGSSAGSNYSQIVRELTACNGTTKDSLKDAVNNLTAAGITRSDLGLQKAQEALGAARSYSQKVVVFFTDGLPTDLVGSIWTTDTANGAIQAASEMKADGTLIYSVAVLDGTDPDAEISTTTEQNGDAFLHAVSSNYPEATGWENGSWVLGDRAEGTTNYYKSAESSEELSNVFSEIADDIQNATAGVPTETTGGYNADGYITFTDQLGDYMQLDSFEGIIYNNEIYKNSTRTENKNEDGAITSITYEFNASVKSNAAVYDSETDERDTNLSNILITVKPGKDARTGDTVEVKIPASLIPLRNFVLNTDDNGNTTMQVSEAYPIRIFYSASVKDGILEPVVNEDGTVTPAAIDNPDGDLQSYIDANGVADGVVRFYSNKYTGESGNGDGDATATFTPSRTNQFYYFGSNTAVYKDEMCTEPATRDDVDNPTSADQPFYYKREFYVANDAANSEPVATENGTTIWSFPASNFTVGEEGGTLNYHFDDGGNLYINPDTHRLTAVGNMMTTKAAVGEQSGNATGTASTVINPTWIDEHIGEGISVALGNNGVLEADLPGSLTVSKSVSIPANGNPSVEDFDYTLTLTDNGAALAGETLQVLVTGKQNTPVEGAIDKLTTDADGKATFTLKDGQSIKIYGLDDGVEYTVEEAGAAGFTASVGDEFGTRGEALSTSGAIEAGETSSVAFTNAYSFTPYEYDTASAFTVSKIFNKWEDDSSFTFQMSSTTPTDPTPSDLVISNDGTLSGQGTAEGKSFGNIKFEHPGEYTYSIYEVTPTGDDAVLGVSYTNIGYALHIEVADKGDGTLKVTDTKLFKLTDDNGNPIDLTDDSVLEGLTPLTPAVASFENTYHAEETKAAIRATKDYTDRSDSKPLASNQFRFRIDGVADASDAQPPMPTSGSVTSNLGDSVVFQIDYDSDDVGKEYVYKLSEVDESAPGVTYDTSVYYAKVVVTDAEADNGDVVTVATVSYWKDAACTEQVMSSNDDGEPIPATGVTFSNTYDPEAVTLGEGDEAPIHGVKTLTGRNMAEGESFGFTLAADANNDASGYTIADGASAASVSNGADGQPVNFSFGKITFTKPGTYTFTVTEDAPEADADGVTYDRHACTVTVKVSDDRGKLSAAVTYDNGTGATDNLQAVFANTYAASSVKLSDAGQQIKVQKNLTGRNWVAGDSFTFELEAKTAGAPMPTTNTTYVNNQGSAVDYANFFGDITYTQAGTYTYAVTETAGDLPGVSYSKDSVAVTVTVEDNGLGQLEIAGVTYGNDEDATAAVFTNTYVPASVVLGEDGTAAIQGTKKLVGRDWTDSDSFEFQLTAADTNDESGYTIPEDADTAVATKDADGAFSFGAIEFSKVGTYTFTINEVAPVKGEAENGIAYDDHACTATVTVTDSPATGKLVATVTYEGDATFTNTYSTTDVPVDTGKAVDTDGQGFAKVLTGRAWAEDDEFSFELTGVSVDGDDSETTVAAMPLPAETTAAVTDETARDENGAASFGFGTIEFSKPGTYVYQVTEVAPEGGVKDGVDYADTAATLTITVTDNGQGALVATSTLANPVFTNEYTAGSVTTTDANGAVGTKVLNAKNSDAKLKAGDFTFNLKQVEGDEVVPTGGLTTTNDADGQISFGTLTFSKTGAYVYEVSEVNAGRGGYTYDGSVFTVTFEVTDGGKGQLEVARSITKDGAAADAIQFTNTYEPASVSTSTVGAIAGSKAVSAQGGNAYKLVAGDFSFELKNESGKVLQTVKNGADGSFSFDALTFTAAGTYSYEVNEVQGGTKGIGYDDGVYAITFQVEDKDGALAITSTTVRRVEGDKATDAKLSGLDFTNTYEPAKTSVGINGTKALVNTDAATDRAIADGEFSFQLAEDGKVLQTVKNTGATFAFDAIEYTEPGEHTYTVSEVPGDDSTIAYDTATHKVTVTVTDEAGELKATVTGLDELSFSNGYTPTGVTVDPSIDPDGDPSAPGSTAIFGTKTLTGRDAAAGEFEFELVDAAGNVVDTATTGAAKAGEAATFNFTKKLSFDKVGTYRYTVREAHAGQTIDGVTYDAAAFGVVITVTEDATAHKLVADVALVKGGEESPIAFTNAYEASVDASLSFAAGKELRGADLADGQFSFTLTGEDGTELTAKNGEDGTVDFGTLTFDAAGEYAFQIREVNDGQEGVTYDDSVYPVVVTVVDNGRGALEVSSVEQDAGAPVFVNVYEEPEVPVDPDDPNGPDEPATPEEPAEPGTPADPGKEPGAASKPSKGKGGKDQLPGTGDTTLMVVGAVGAVAVAAIGAGAVLIRRRNR